MRRIILLVILAAIAWQGQSRYRSQPPADPQPAAIGAPQAVGRGSEVAASFACDGRIHCSQMSSCAQAEYFLKNCPGVTMDGDRDGVPCEQQWCGR